MAPAVTCRPLARPSPPGLARGGAAGAPGSGFFGSGSGSAAGGAGPAGGLRPLAVGGEAFTPPPPPPYSSGAEGRRPGGGGAAGGGLGGGGRSAAGERRGGSRPLRGARGRAAGLGGEDGGRAGGGRGLCSAGRGAGGGAREGAELSGAAGLAAAAVAEGVVRPAVNNGNFLLREGCRCLPACSGGAAVGSGCAGLGLSGAAGSSGLTVNLLILAEASRWM